MTAATPAEVPAVSSLAGQTTEHATPQTAEQIELGRKLGEAIAADIVEEIRGGMGLPAKKASSSTQPEINDIVLRGYLLSVDEGNATKRVAFGYGAAENNWLEPVQVWRGGKSDVKDLDPEDTNHVFQYPRITRKLFTYA